MDDGLYRRHINRIANTDEARSLMQLIGVAVEAYATFWASFGVTVNIELKHPTKPSDNPSTIRLFADWPTAKHKLHVAVIDDDLDEIDLLVEKPEREAN